MSLQNSDWIKNEWSSNCGPLALIGGSEWGDGATYDTTLLAASNSDLVTLLPTASAFEHPMRAVEKATNWFSRIGARVEPVMVLNRDDSNKIEYIKQLEKATFIYIGGGSPLHLRSVLRDSEVLLAVISAWQNGAVLAGSSAGAMVLGNPMVDPRGGAFTVGLGVVQSLAVIPHFESFESEKVNRTFSLAPPSVVVAAIPERTALMRWNSSQWSVEGVGEVILKVNGKVETLENLTKL